MVSRMFEFLFKYSRATFERAEMVLASGWPVWLLFALVAVQAAQAQTLGMATSDPAAAADRPARGSTMATVQDAGRRGR